MNILVTYLGCKLNWAELESFGRKLAAQGHHIVDDPAKADWAIVNTCAVTHVAARKSRQMIRRLVRENPGVRIAAVGCYAEIEPDTVRALDGVTLCLGNQAKHEVVERLLEEETGPTPAPSSSRAVATPRTRAFCRIQDGCDNQCSYCVVTIARGPQRSVTPQGVLQQVRARIAEGYQEIVLTGVHIGAYGQDAEGIQTPNSTDWSLARLGHWLLQETSVSRLRLSSIEPWDATDALLDLWPHPRLCPHLHLPLQSGCDATLDRMARRYTTDAFRQRVQGFRRRVPQGAVTTDIMVGFPGETEQEFEKSLAFVREMAFSRLHVFRYSSRPGTLAAEFPDHVPPETAKERSQTMRDLGRALAHNYHRGLIGAIVPVLFEDRKDGDWRGLTDTYVRANVSTDASLHNRIIPVRCTRASAQGIRGKLVNDTLQGSQ